MKTRGSMKLDMGRKMDDEHKAFVNAFGDIGDALKYDSGNQEIERCSDRAGIVQTAHHDKGFPYVPKENFMQWVVQAWNKKINCCAIEEMNERGM